MTKTNQQNVQQLTDYFGDLDEKQVHLIITNKLDISGLNFIIVKAEKCLLFHNLP